MISGSGLLAMRNKLQATGHKIFAWAPFWALSVTAAIAQDAVEADIADEPLAPSDAITANEAEQADAAEHPRLTRRGRCLTMSQPNPSLKISRYLFP